MIRAFANWPVERAEDGRVPRVTSGFGDGRGHRGVDIFFAKRLPSPPRHPWSTERYEIPRGTLALAVLPGVVTKARRHYEPFSAWAGRRLADKFTGWVVEIDHGDGLRTVYHHLFTPLVREGQRVDAGQPLAPVGGSPNRLGSPPGTPGPVHLHFETWVRGVPVDPGPFLLRTRVTVRIRRLAPALAVSGVATIALALATRLGRGFLPLLVAIPILPP